MKSLARVLLLIGAACGAFPPDALAQPPDPLDGKIVREIRVTGLRRLSPDEVERHLATRVGEPFNRANVALDLRRLDELRLFTAVTIEPQLENDGVVVHVTATETLKLLPTVVLKVTDENGVSIGPGLRGINLLGHGSQVGMAAFFGGETSVGVSADKTTITPGTWAQHVAFNYHQATQFPLRLRRAHDVSRGARLSKLDPWPAGRRAWRIVLALDAGSSGKSLVGRRLGRHSDARRVRDD